MELNRFGQGLKDMQEEAPVENCDNCGSEIYEGENYLDYHGERACCIDCLIDLTGTTLRTAGE